MASPLVEHVVQPPINPQHLAYCPVMDLIALATVDERVHVYRLNGNEVLGVVDRHGPSKVRKITWRANGHSLAVAFDSQSLCLTDSQTGKVLHNIDCSIYTDAPICCLGWGYFLLDTGLPTAQAQSRGLGSNEVDGRPRDGHALDARCSLPYHLSFLDVEQVLPKLSPLSTGTIDDDAFTLRSSLDEIFRPLTLASADSADVLMAGFEDGTVHISMYDFFEVGAFPMGDVFDGAAKCIPLLHSFHPQSTTHTLLGRPAGDMKSGLFLVPVDLRLLSNAGRSLAVLASKSTQMRHLLRYVLQVQRQIVADFKAALEVPTRFIRNIEEALEQKGEWTWPQAAFHLVVTGDCPEDVREWMVDQLGERGHKRWEKAMISGYESVRRLVHEHLLPALERFVVLASRLRGLSRFPASNHTLGLSTQGLDVIQDTLNCLQLVAHEILLTTGSELAHFRAFAAWLHEEMDAQSSEGSTGDTPDIAPGVDHSSILDYIGGAMTCSRLSMFLNLEPDRKDKDEWDPHIEEGSLFDSYKAELNKAKTSKPSTTKAPRLDALTMHLERQCSTFFSKIAEARRRNVRFGRPLQLCSGEPKTLAARMVHQSAGEFLQYVAFGNDAEKPHSKDGEILLRSYRLMAAALSITRMLISIVNGMSSVKDVRYSHFDLGEFALRDMDFVDDAEIMLAVSSATSSRLLMIPYLSLEYRDIEGGKGRLPVEISLSEQLQDFTWLSFVGGMSWTPQRLALHSKRGRRAVCVLAEDGLHYRIYDLDSRNEVKDVDESMEQGGA